MKKIVAIITTIILLFSLCGCEKYSDYKEIESRLFVSALGIDETSSGITLYAESAISNSTSEGYKVSVLSSTADTIPEAFDGIKNSTPLSLDLSHLAVIILGKCKEDTEKKLGQYLLSKPEDMLSCYFVYCDSAKDLISCGKDTPIGYSLSYALKKNYYAGGKRTNSTLLDILNSPEAFSLPYFVASKLEFSYAGAVYYKGVERIAIKDENEARLIRLLSGDFLRGGITVKGKTYDIKNTNFSQSVNDDSIKIILSVSLDSNTEIDTLKNELLRVLNEWKEDYKVNIFRFSSKGKPLSNAEFQKYAIDLTVKPTN